MAGVSAHAAAARREKAVRLGDAAALRGFGAWQLNDAAVRAAVLGETGDRSASEDTWAAAAEHRAAICEHLLDAAACAGGGRHYA